MTNERRELVKALAVASYAHARTDKRTAIMPSDWVSDVINDADVLLAALDQQSPPTQIADIPRCPRCGHALRPQLMGTLVCDSCGTTHPPQAPTGSATAAPGGEPKERVCVWRLIDLGDSALYRSGCGTYITVNRGGDRGIYCRNCGGKIITEAT